METGELKILLALESLWTVSVNGLEFLVLPSTEIVVQDSAIRIGRLTRRIITIDWLRPNIVRIHARTKLRTEPDVLTFYPGERLPTDVDLRRRRRRFQNEIGGALCAYFGARAMQRQTLHSDRQHGIGGAYSRFLFGNHAAISVDPDETSAVINGVMRAALLWQPLVRRRISVVVPSGRHHTIASRLRVTPRLREALEWLEWDGASIRPLNLEAPAPESHVHEYKEPMVQTETARICSYAPDLLQAVPNIAGKAVSIRLRGIEVARIVEEQTSYPLGEPIERVIQELAAARRHGSRHPLARAHEERWLESNLIGNLHLVLPSIDGRHIYPQVPSFVGEERNIVDLLAITREGRLVVVEIKASADPDLPFQALDYWIAVERHRQARDFQQKGYFKGCSIRDEAAILVLVAPLLAFHKTLAYLRPALPGSIPLMEIGINQTWKREIKILRRRGSLG